LKKRGIAPLDAPSPLDGASQIPQRRQFRKSERDEVPLRKTIPPPFLREGGEGDE
jgi:hypothetical protein